MQKKTIHFTKPSNCSLVTLLATNRTEFSFFKVVKIFYHLLFFFIRSLENVTQWKFFRIITELLHRNPR